MTMLRGITPRGLGNKQRAQAQRVTGLFGYLDPRTLPLHAVTLILPLEKFLV